MVIFVPMHWLSSGSLENSIISDPKIYHLYFRSLRNIIISGLKWLFSYQCIDHRIRGLRFHILFKTVGLLHLASVLKRTYLLIFEHFVVGFIMRRSPWNLFSVFFLLGSFFCSIYQQSSSLIKRWRRF